MQRQTMLSDDDKMNLEKMISLLFHKGIISFKDDDKISFIQHSKCSEVIPPHLITAIRDSQMFEVYKTATIVAKAMVKPKYLKIFKIAKTVVEL